MPTNHITPLTKCHCLILGREQRVTMCDSAALVDIDKSGRGLERIFEKDHTTKAGAPLGPSSSILPKKVIILDSATYPQCWVRIQLCHFYP